MTAIRFRTKPVWHETGAVCSGRPILTAESPQALLIRLKGTRQVLELPWGMAFLRAASLKASVNALARINNRKRRGVVRGRI